ncbi:MAG: fructose-bisphosphate aldolase class I [Candidatus Saccharibacteria bacterium]|nr:fructose-bisphosphate aldolase class I [Candidatus Saccharibacteria bacterium]
MHILVVGNVLKDVYLNLDSRVEQFEPDSNGVEWLDFSFDTSQHHYATRMSSFGGAAITLEVLQKMGLKADISDTSFHFNANGPVLNGPTGMYRYILTSDNGTSYMLPSVEKETSFTTPSDTVDYLFIDRSANLSPSAVDKIIAYLEYSKKTKLIFYVKDMAADGVKSLIKHAALLFLEENRGKAERDEALQSSLKDGALSDYPKDRMIFVSENHLRYNDYVENIVVNRIDRLTHLSAFSIMAATVLGGFILGKTVEYSLKIARINVENATLDATLSLTELENIAASTSESNLELIAEALMAPMKGILAMDESGGSIHKKFEALGIKDTAENRHDYREILLSTPDIENFLTGVILFDETARDIMANGRTVPDYLIDRGIIPGIKVDKGLAPIGELAPMARVNEARPEETYTKGLDDLPLRLREYYQMGLRFCKWRAAFEIRLDSDGLIITPTMAAIKENCRILAEYAAVCQSAGMVPIVEPEVVYDGKYSIEQCAKITARVLDELFKALEKHGVNLKACILKCNMVMAGKKYAGGPGRGAGAVPASGFSPEEVATATAKVLTEHVPLYLAGIVFLSGGQTPAQATANLEAIMRRQKYAWPISFSFSRALQNPALEAWAGDNNNAENAKAALLERLLDNCQVLK